MSLEQWRFWCDLLYWVTSDWGHHAIFCTLISGSHDVKSRFWPRGPYLPSLQFPLWIAISSTQQLGIFWTQRVDVILSFSAQSLTALLGLRINASNSFAWLLPSSWYLLPALSPTWCSFTPQHLGFSGKNPAFLCSSLTGPLLLLPPPFAYLVGVFFPLKLV